MSRVTDVGLEDFPSSTEGDGGLVENLFQSAGSQKSKGCRGRHIFVKWQKSGRTSNICFARFVPKQAVKDNHIAMYL